MLKIRLIVVDRTRSPFLKQGERHYLDRVRKYTSVDMVEVKPVKIKKGTPENAIITNEGNSIARKIDSNDFLISLDRRGDQCSSMELADLLNGLSTQVRGWVCFAIGGPLGLSKEILEHSHKILSLSRLTLTHEMTRLFLLEQLYRAFTIMNREKYHK